MENDEDTVLEEFKLKLTRTGSRLLRYAESENPKKNLSNTAIAKDLELLESLLLVLNQDPSVAMRIALVPASKALIRKKLLHHRLKNIRLLVLSCVAELLRITAPHQAYSGPKLLEFFDEVLATFENMGFAKIINKKKVVLLSNLANVSAFILLLDLDCPDLVLRVFKVLFSSLDSNPRMHVCEAAVDSMERIMRDLVDNSDEIPDDVLQLFFGLLRKDFHGHSQELAARVLVGSAEALRSYILGLDLNLYHEALSQIIEQQGETPVEQDGGGSGMESELKKNDDEKEEENDLVGKWIRVLDKDDTEYYGGVITGYSEENGKHTVAFDDGEVKHLDLFKERWNFQYFA